LVPDLRAAAGDDLEHVIGKAGSLQNLCKPDRGKWRLAMRFQNHGIAGSDGRSNLVCDEVQRVVKGRNRHDHAHRLVDEVSRTPFTARTLRERYGLANQPSSLFPRKTQGHCGPNDLLTGFPDRLDPFGRYRARKGFGILLEQGRRLRKNRSTHVHRHRPRVPARLEGRIERQFDVGRICTRNAADEGAVLGIADLHSGPAWHPSAGEQHELIIHNRLSDMRSYLRRSKLAA